MERDTEALRKELLDEACAGAFSGLEEIAMLYLTREDSLELLPLSARSSNCLGLGAMILDADEIQNADGSKLEEIARRYGK